MGSDDDDSGDMFIMGPGMGGHRSIFTARQDSASGAQHPSDSDDSLGVEDPSAPKQPKRRGRAPKAQNKGKAAKEKAQKRAEKHKEKVSESVFVVDAEVSDEYSEDDDDAEIGALQAKKGKRGKNDGGEVIDVVDLEGEDEAPRRPRRRKRPRRVVELSEGSESDAPEETELERRLRLSVAAARGAAEAFSEEKVAAEAAQEEQRRHEEEARVAAAAAEARAAREAEARAAARETDDSVVRLSVRCLGSEVSPLQVRMRGEHRLGKLKPGACKRFKAAGDHAVLFHEGTLLLESESLEGLGIKSGSTLEMRVSDQPVVSLKVRVKGEILLPSVCVRYDDPILCIHHLVCKKAGLAPERVSLELDGEMIEETDTCKGLDVESGTLVEAIVK